MPRRYSLPAPEMPPWSLWLRRAIVVGGIALLAAAIWFGQPWRDVELPQTVVVYSFSAMDGVLQDEILPVFARRWRSRTAENVEFVTTFAGSGAITAEIVGRVPVDLAVLSSEIDALRLTRRGFTQGQAWKELPRQGVLTRSPMVILVREGNPKQIESFDDLLREDVTLVHCDPLTSGAGEWGLAAFHAVSVDDPDPRAAAAARIERLRDRVVALEPSARTALLAFAEKEVGDALITYEREWLGLAPLWRHGIEAVYPDTTINSEHLLLRPRQDPDPKRDELIDALVEFLFAEEAQAMFEAAGFMRSDSDPRQRAECARVLTLADLGGAQELERNVMATWHDDRANEKDLAESGK